MVNSRGLMGDPRLLLGQRLIPPYLSHMNFDEVPADIKWPIWWLTGFKPHGDCIVYSWLLDPGDVENEQKYLAVLRMAKAANTEGMLDAFVRLQNGKDILRFAERYGVLEICGHGLPSSHNPPGYPSPDNYDPFAFCLPLSYKIGKFICYWEPIERWLYYARQAEAIVLLAAKLHQEERTRAEHWLTLDREADMVEKSHEEQWKALTEVVDHWLRLGNAQTSFRWNFEAEEPSFTLEGGTFAALAIQLMATVSRKDKGLAICSGCGLPYFRKRKPQANRNNYCPTCAEQGIGERDRQRRLRQRRSERTDS